MHGDVLLVLIVLIIGFFILGQFRLSAGTGGWSI